MPTVIYVNKLKDIVGPFIGLSRVVLVNGRPSLKHVRNVRGGLDILETNPTKFLSAIARSLSAINGLEGPFTFYDSQTGQKYEY